MPFLRFEAIGLTTFNRQPTNRENVEKPLAPNSLVSMPLSRCVEIKDEYNTARDSERPVQQPSCLR